MILRRLSLRNWRAHARLDLAFSSGFSVLRGANEAGKSSLVEALQWALERDLFAQNAEKVRAIVPVHDQSAQPRVELEIEFADCRAVISKTLAAAAEARECRLHVFHNDAQTTFEGAEAQTQWRALIARDSLAAEHRADAADNTSNDVASPVVAGLLVARQSAGADFLRDGGPLLPGALRLSARGELVLPPRLERLRRELGRRRAAELEPDLQIRALDTARDGTEAARVRAELLRLRDDRARLAATLGEIAAWERELEPLERSLKTARELEMRAKSRIEELGTLLTRQSEADIARREAETRVREATLAREEARRTSDEIARLEAEKGCAERELEALELQNRDAAQTLAEKLQALEAAGVARQNAENELERVRELVAAWRAVWDVYEAQARLEREKRARDELQSLGDALQRAQKALDATPKAPSSAELDAWRVAWQSFAALEAEARQTLIFQITARGAAQRLRWRLDDGSTASQTLEDGAERELRAVMRATLFLEGWGEIEVASGARGVDEVRAELETARHALRDLLRDWRVDVAALPGAFGIWEERRRGFEAAQKTRDEAAQTLDEAQNRLGSLHQAPTRLEHLSKELEVSRARALPLQERIAFRGLRRAEVREALDAALIAEDEARRNATRASNAAHEAARDVQVAQDALSSRGERPAELRAIIEERRAGLQRLRADGLSDEAREAKLAELNVAALQARRARDEANFARRDLGDGVSPWTVEAARREHLERAGELAKLEKQQLETATRLRMARESEPEIALAKVEARLVEVEALAAKFETQLRALALLHDALEREHRQRVQNVGIAPGRDLTEQLANWLSRLRGRSTELRFAPDGSRLEAVVSEDGSSQRVEVPFEAGSEGLREQIGLLLRLLIVRDLARRTPSGTLPLVLDDPLAASDAARRAALFDLLGEAASNLQILFVTCHEVPLENAASLRLDGKSNPEELERETATLTLF